MDTPASIILMVLALIMFQRAREHTLGKWLRAKFLNSTEKYGAPGTENEASAGFLKGATDSGISQTGWTFPVPGAAIGNRRFGTQTHPVYGDLRMHSGVDIGAAYGAPILSAQSGKVTFAGSSGGYGYRVDVDHGGGIVTRYAHMSKIDVILGQVVNAGERLGQVGSTGTSTSPHLHFEVRQGGVAIDPYPMLAGGIAQVRA